MDDDIAAKIQRIAQEAKARNPEGFQDGSSVSSADEDSKSSGSNSSVYVNPASGQTFALLATAVNVPLHLEQLA